jgi:hypothetical protein
MLTIFSGLNQGSRNSPLLDRKRCTAVNLIIFLDEKMIDPNEYYKE